MIFRIFFWVILLVPIRRENFCPGTSGHGAHRAKPTSETTPGCGAWHMMSLRDPLGPFWYILAIHDMVDFFWDQHVGKYTVRLRPMDSFLMLLQSLIFSCTISLNEWHLSSHVLVFVMAGYYTSF